MRAMWTYVVESGWLLNDKEDLVAHGYSGHGLGHNNPHLQTIKMVGPIPIGLWRVTGPPRDTDTHGPYVLGLTPEPKTLTFGRSGFLIHGDSHTRPGEASLGCIVLPRFAREAVWDSGDHLLSVVPRYAGISGSTVA